MVNGDLCLPPSGNSDAVGDGCETSFSGSDGGDPLDVALPMPRPRILACSSNDCGGPPKASSAGMKPALAELADGVSLYDGLPLPPGLRLGARVGEAAVKFCNVCHEDMLSDDGIRASLDLGGDDGGDACVDGIILSRGRLVWGGGGGARLFGRVLRP